MFETSLKIKESYYGKNHMETMKELTNLGTIY